MQIIRTIILLLVAIAITAFLWMNWTMVTVNILPNWQTTAPGTPSPAPYIWVHWPLGIVMIVTFLFGLVPTWVIAKAGRWRLKRRIAALENTVRATTPTPPLATSTQLEAAAAQSDGPIGH